MPTPKYDKVKKAEDIPPLAVVVKDMLKDYDLPPDPGSTVRSSGR